MSSSGRTLPLHRRPISPDGAEPNVPTLAAELGAAAFRVAFQRWVSDDESTELAWSLHDWLDRMGALLAP